MNKRSTSPSEPAPREMGWPQKTSWNFLILTAVTTVFFWKVFVNPAAMLWANDVVRAHSTYKAVQWRSLWEYGSFPLWDPTIYCGKSIVGDPLPMLLNPQSWLFWLIPSPIMFGFFFWLQITLGTWGTFLFARSRGCNAPSSVFAAIAFALGGKTAAHVFAGHVEVVSTMLGLPWILWATEVVLKKPSLRTAALWGGVTALVASNGSVQVMYWHMLFTALYAAIRVHERSKEGGWREGLRPLGSLAMGGVVFALAACAWWLPIVRQTLLLSARSKGVDFEFATMGSMGYADLLRLLWPFNGVPEPQALRPDTVHEFFWETASGPGVTTLCLVVAAIIILRKRYDLLAFGSLGLLALLLALGQHSPVYWLAYKVVPGFSLFRAPGRLLFYANLVMAVLAGHLLTEGATLKKRWVVPLVPAILVEVAFIVPIALRAPYFDPSAGRWIPLVVSLALTPLAFLWAYNSLPERYWQRACLAVLAFELLLVWGPHIHVVQERQAFPPSSVARFLAERRQEEEFRVLDMTFTVEQQMAARHGLELVTGYHPGIYARHLDLYKRIWQEDDSDLVELSMHSPRESACPVIPDMMNAKYVIAFESNLGPDYELVYQSPPQEFQQVRYVHQRKDALPRAWLVGKAEAPPADQTVLDMLCEIDPRETCLVEDRPVDGNAQYQELAVQRRSPGDLTLTFTAEKPGIAIVSQSWHPDWRATDNGDPVEVRRVNYGQVGIPVGAGDHDLHVWYRPWDFYLGCGSSAGAWAMILVLVVGLGVRSARRAERASGPSTGSA